MKTLENNEFKEGVEENAAHQFRSSTTITPIQLSEADQLLTMIEKVSLTPGVDITTLEKMLELKQKYDKENAKKSFFKAFSTFQQEMPPIVSEKDGYGYKYAPLCDITRIALPYLHQNGLSYRFEHADENNKISVTCIVTHVHGHYEKTTSSADLLSSPTNSGGKSSMNDLQRMGATVTYLRRYTLTSILGITTADKDSDGRLEKQPSHLINGAQLGELEEMLKPFSKDRDKFLARCRVEKLKDLPIARFDSAKAMLVKKAKAS